MNAVQRLLTDHIDIWTAAETEKKSGRGRSSGNAASVYGIKKLRELILELAVRGKLVPQDANDEPASELLKRIQIEKSNLFTEGKIKNSKLLHEEVCGEMPFTLPTGWAYSRLGNVVDIIRGITFPGSEKTKTPGDGRVACLRTSNVQDEIEWHDILYIREEFVSRNDQILMPRDIVMSMANSRELVGKVALVGSTINQRTSFGGFLGVLRPYLIEPRFVMALLRTPHTREALIDSASQTTNIANISLAKLRPLFFAIPPIAEQHRIVAKVDELMTLCDQLEAQHSDAADVHEQLVSHLLGTLTQSQSAADFSSKWQRIAAHFDTLFTTEASIEALKQTLLQLAVMGKLVAQDANDEPASELLKRIVAEKAKLVAEGEVKKDKLVAPISKNEKPFELPPNWEWIRVATVSKMITSGSRDWAQYISDEGAKFITMGNLSRGNYELRLDNIRFVNPPKTGEGSRTKLEAHDLLCSITGEVGNLGRIPENFGEAYINQHTCLLRFLPQCKNRYFPEALRSPLASMQFNAPQRGIKNSFRLGDLSEMVIPLPPLAEQHRIVVRIDELMELCDQLISCITDANHRQKKLAEVLVANAVMG